jgi:hypothetical protein
MVTTKKNSTHPVLWAAVSQPLALYYYSKMSIFGTGKSEDALVEEKKDGLWLPRAFFTPTQFCGTLDLHFGTLLLV